MPSSKLPDGELAYSYFPDNYRWSHGVLIALGGGRSVRIWLNGKKLYRSIAATDSVGLMGQLVQVGRKLTSRDRIQMLVCSRDSAKTMGVALSFWTEGEIDSTCKARGWKEPEAAGHEQGWPVIGKFRQTCFGSYIRPEKS